MAASGTVGLGYKSESVTSAPFSALWKVMVDKVYHPDKFLPVTDVSCETTADGIVHRKMTMIANKETITEDIVCDESSGIIKFVHVDDDKVIVNELHKEDMTIEYYQTNKAGQRIPWEVQSGGVAKAIQTTIEKATVIASAAT
eukprot:TRINITY_DN16004_c0_g1_i1.p1 TRINITY_DN16004_c0_g1~~TRINITY_DN16004_c0_g1_i1.p1  ORF type:complete len:143 (-),score=27.94 TRINITY_DN16004_c0_g1_i1:191-619(-)